MRFHQPSPLPIEQFPSPSVEPGQRLQLLVVEESERWSRRRKREGKLE